MRQTGNGRMARIGAAAHPRWSRSARAWSLPRPARGRRRRAAQLGAWAIQLSACWALLFALGLSGHAGIGAAAAVLFAVNVTAVVPATPSNIGVFQLAVISVLHTGFGVGPPTRSPTASSCRPSRSHRGGLGLPALVREGLTWSDLRVQAISSAPVHLEPQPRPRPRHVQRERSTSGVA